MEHQKTSQVSWAKQRELAENNLNAELCQALKTRTEIHCKTQRVDFPSVQESYEKCREYICNLSGSVMLGISHFRERVVDFLYLDFSYVILFRSYLHETMATFNQIS